ncbi:hydrogenase maturation nickel metallochaperone HypA, partial [Candidatus Beckwithbacteria bacterium CG23_combo_of_CG06-09_8_20_14_all_34_8]
MHEISIAQSILETVKKSIVNLNVTKINKIYISIGVLSGVE